MKSDKAGTTISETKTEITNISSHGIWLFHNEKEYFLSYEEFPWFKDSKVQDILNVETPSPTHFYWPNLDVDLHLDSIEKPDKYPLVSF